MGSSNLLGVCCYLNVDIREQQHVAALDQEVSNKQAKGTKDNDLDTEETYFRADLEVSVGYGGRLRHII